MKKSFEKIPLRSLPLTVRVTAIPITATDTRRSVLVVDDDRKTANTLVRVLELNGFRAEAAYTGETGLERAREIRPDMVLTDVGLPKMDGITMADSVASLLPRTQIVLMCERLPETSSLLTWSVLKKPVRPTDLLALLSLPAEARN
jgi:DNA-binding response OmpR family regulator